MDSRHFYFEIPDEHRGKTVELPKHPGIGLYKNYAIQLHVPENARCLILGKIGILHPTIMYLDEEGLPAISQDRETLLFTEVLEKRLSLAFKKVEDSSTAERLGVIIGP